MLGPVNSGTTTSSSQAQGTSGSSAASQTSQVSQGYSSTGSSSTSSSSGATITTTTLQAPEDVNTTAEEFVSKSLDAHIDARLSAVRFNQKIDPSDVYLNDTDSLILMMKSFVNELVALASIQSIDQALGNRLQAQSVRETKAKEAVVLKVRIQERQDEIQTVNQRINDGSASLADKSLSKNLKEQQLADAEQEHQSGVDRSDDIARFKAQLTMLEHEIANIESEVSGLRDDVSELQSLNAADEEVVSAYKRALDVVQEELVNVGNLVGRVKQRFDGEALQTGEENVAAVKEAEKEVALEARREEMRLKARSDRSRDLGKDSVRADVQRSDNVQEEKLFESQLSFLPPREAAVLREVFGRIDFNQLQEALKADKQLTGAVGQSPKRQRPEAEEELASASRQKRPAVDEGLAIVLQSALKELPDVESEEQTNPAASTFRGDNLSFEGAKNPLIFAELWLQAQMKQGEATQEVKEEHLEDGMEAVAQTETARVEASGAEQLQQQGFVDALQEFATIPEETAESLDEGKQAEAYISRNSPV